MAHEEFAQEREERTIAELPGGFTIRKPDFLAARKGTKAFVHEGAQNVGESTQQATTSIAEFTGETLSESAAGAVEGAGTGLFGDLRRTAGTIVLLVVGLLVASIVFGIRLPLGGDGS